IDYVNGAVNGSNPADNDGSNIINSPDDFPEITPSVLASLNEAGGETNVSTGFHSIEFLLWGQDVSAGAGGGERTFADYVVGGTVANAERRAAYINAAADLLVSDLQSLVDEWTPGSAFRSNFTSADNADASLESLMNGIGKLSKGELAGERMFVAWDLKSKEDEHSCFSDNTHRDIVTNAIGIENVYYGRYVRVDGTIVDGVGLDEVTEIVNPTLNTEMKALLESSSIAVNAIQAPFDQEILGADADPGRVRVKAGFDALRAQGDKLAEIASALGYTLDPDDI
ncbi:MAG: imelysin family protein, partial [Bacteroidota bacterium]